jgi:alanyl-tRNA synthetase
MRAAEIRQRFLEYFARNGHAIRPSSSLVPQDDPTLLFTNAGMVQFKKVFLGLEEPSFGNRRATTSQKCVRAGGKHNDLEQVGHTARHHTFFEMLGNFSFGDYFKSDAIAFGWEFVTRELGIDPSLIYVSVHHSDGEARELWKTVAGLPDHRIYGLGDRDNFWQMAETGPCGPCTEIYVDLARVAGDWRFPAGAAGEWTDTSTQKFPLEAFVEGAEAGRFLEIWNLVFMQYDRQPDGELQPLPRPSVDTGAGLERIAAVMQGVTNNYHTDLFAPLLETVEQTVGLRYRGRESDEVTPAEMVGGGRGGLDVVPAVDPASFRVLADHARAVAFLLADGVFPSNEGRGYVLRRILRRAVRHAWLLGRKEPTLSPVVQRVIEVMGKDYPELQSRARHLVEATRVEEAGFLATIEGGLSRFEQLAPQHTTQGGSQIRGTISGEDAFRLYDTFGFPIDLTELMARERGYTVDIAGFERALDAQRNRSKEERRSKQLSVEADALGELGDWERSDSDVGAVSFVGYEKLAVDTEVVAMRRLPDGRLAVLLRDSPFYVESGGQISDRGEIMGDGWRLEVEDVRRIEGRPAAVGRVEGDFHFGRVVASVPGDRRRDTERNHTATHLLHAALREALGDQVHQAGSLVAPDRLRFDFTHHGPVPPQRLSEIEERVNEWIWAATPVAAEEMELARARERGAMALFGEKYGDVVRVISVPGVSMELCGGTHVRNTSEIGLFRIVAESGVAAGIRRIEALTGPAAFDALREREAVLSRIAEMLRVPHDGVERRVSALMEERRGLERRLEEAMRGGGDAIQRLVADAADVEGVKVVAASVAVDTVKDLQTLGDALRERLGSGVGVLAASLAEGKHAMLAIVTDDLRERGLRADDVIREVAAVAGGRGGGKPHMAQAGITDPARIPAALEQVASTVRKHLQPAA